MTPALTLALLAAAVALVSAVFYARRRAWANAALTVAAGVTLAVLLARPSTPAVFASAALAVNAQTQPAEVSAAPTLSVAADGLRAAQWRDLPARPLQWTAAAIEALRLDFPRQLSLGRVFVLSVQRASVAPARLQLIAENGQVLAEASGAAKALSVHWTPPVAETLLLKARLSDAKGAVLAEGPIPVQVQAAPPLQVQGRFNAPSFDALVLNQMLANSNAILDWQVTLGKTLARAETARSAMSAPNLLVVDAAWFEHTHGAARAATLAQVAQGMSLIVLGASAADAALWQRELQLGLHPQPEDKAAGTLPMSAAALNPSTGGAWQSPAPYLWTRDWQQGHILWLGLADWHRYAITDPAALGAWWQTVLDHAGVQRLQEQVLLPQEDMPLPGQRMEICAQGVKGDLTIPELKQSLAWQTRIEQADAHCVAIWPTAPGWLHLEPMHAAVYVYGPQDWPQVQASERRAATLEYAARTPKAQTASSSAMAAWPFALLFFLLIGALWWRERA